MNKNSSRYHSIDFDIMTKYGMYQVFKFKGEIKNYPNNGNLDLAFSFGDDYTQRAGETDLFPFLGGCCEWSKGLVIM